MVLIGHCQSGVAQTDAIQGTIAVTFAGALITIMENFMEVALLLGVALIVKVLVSVQIMVDH
jgi:hypothetical protein